MRYEDGSALLHGLGVEFCQPFLSGRAPLSEAPIPPRSEPAVRHDSTTAGLIALECCRNGMPTGAAVRSIATAFGLPAAVVAMQLGRARRRQRSPTGKILA